MTRDELVARWFALTREVLPDLAARRQWPVDQDHCFQRILLDNAVGAAWRTRIRPPAWRHADDIVLARAIALGEEVIGGRADLAALDRKSLEWRGKRHAPPRRQ